VRISQGFRDAERQESNEVTVNSRVYIGTSGWNYKHWLGPFYPSNMRDREMLSFYAEHFDTVEVNNSYYHLPTFKSFNSWHETVPADFSFAVKASRFITHMKKLKAPRTSTKKFFTRVDRLAAKLGPILFQLPPRWRCNPERLKNFLEALPAQHRYCFEFRDRSWHVQEIYQLLRKHNAAFCFYHLTGFDSPLEVTADFVYVRLHGTETKYGGSYSTPILKEWARRIGGWRSDSKDVYFYFNNDPEGHAIKNALKLRELVRD